MDQSGSSQPVDDSEAIDEELIRAGDEKAKALSEERNILASLASKENKAVSVLRIVVLSLLCVAGVAFSGGAYLSTSLGQQKAFLDSFDGYATNLIDSFHKAVESKLEAVDSLSVAITAHALGTNSTFPFVTLPSFEIQGANTRILSGTVLLNYAPVVSDADRAAWEIFANETKSQFAESISVEMQHRAVQDASFEVKGRELQEELHLIDYIHNLEETGPAVNGTGPYLPIWQQSPAVPFGGLMNFNLMSHPTGQNAYREAMRTGTAVLDFADNMNQEAYGETGLYIQLVLSMGQYRDVVDEFLGDPSSVVAYPVFDSLNPTTRKVTGMFSTTIYWRLYFERILPEQAKGIYCVLKNNFNQTITFRVDGPTTTYLGPRDMHDPKYDDLVHPANVNDYITSIASKTTKSYTSVDLNNDFGQYRLYVYPSSDTEGQFRDSTPIYHTITVAGVIFFTSAVLLVYDFVVRRRQKILMDRAVASGTIVASLFPSQVRDQLYQETRVKKPTSTMHDMFLADKADVVHADAPIIADLFPETTILFADMAGFTHWSSTRTPEQVFHLLETLYGAFDEIALQRHVFKVETIGDCYVAVTGIPKPQEAHAVIMAKFASHCMTKMREVTSYLSDSLGEDTSELELRVGLHSGEVTAGVLRGQKSRFQLFGPTMNQASRMESTGKKGRIQVSQETADELKAHGKGHWLQQREDKITAKGLGDLTTYWVTVSGGTASVATTTVSSNNEVVTQSQ